MSIRFHQQCDVCKHAVLVDGVFVGECRAYPDGIPGVLLRGEVDHRQPYPGDNGIRFEPLPGRRHPLEVIEENRRRGNT